MDGKDHVPQVHAARADQLALAAKHALFDLLPDLLYLSAPDKSMYPADIEICQLAGSTCRRAAAACNADVDRGFQAPEPVDILFIIAIVIDLPVGIDGISEILHPDSFLSIFRNSAI